MLYRPFFFNMVNVVSTVFLHLSFFLWTTLRFMRTAVPKTASIFSATHKG